MESPLFVSVYDKLYFKNSKRRQIEVKSDAEIVDDIFKEKLNKSKPPVEKAKGLAAFQKKQEVKIDIMPTVPEVSRIASDKSDSQFIVSLFK